MTRNDLIQGIVFDAKQTITFQEVPKTKISRLILDIKRQVVKTKKSYTGKKFKPVFSTDLMPAKNASLSTVPVNKTTAYTKRVILR